MSTESKNPIKSIETIEKEGNPEIIKRELNKRKKRKEKRKYEKKDEN